MFRETFPVGPLQCNCSILAGEAAHEAIVVDPGDEIAGIVARLQKRGLTLKQIIVTHAHIDHVGGAEKLRKLTGARVLMNRADMGLLEMMDMQAGWLGVPSPQVAPPDDDAEDGLLTGLPGLPVEILFTPGHTPGSVCLHLPPQKLLLAGDTLFSGSIGRTDLPGGDPRRILHSLRSRLLILPDETHVVPGHGSETTIGRERRCNPFLQPGVTL